MFCDESISQYSNFEMKALIFIISSFAIGLLLSAEIVGSIQFGLELLIGFAGFSDGLFHDFHFSFEVFDNLLMLFFGHIGLFFLFCCHNIIHFFFQTIIIL